MANKIFVKLTQTLTKIGNFNVVTSGGVQLVARGPGNSTITAADQDAVIEFFEQSNTSTVILTITGKVKLDGSTPKFDLNSATRQSTVTRSDFTLPLSFDSTTFDGSQFASQFSLTLPWTVIKRNNVANFRVGAQLKIHGTLEGAAFGDVLDLPLLHQQVADDMDSGVNDTCLGIGTVYPTNNRFLTGNQTIGQTAKVDIILQDGVRARFDALTPAPPAPTPPPTQPGAPPQTPPAAPAAQAVNPAKFISSIQANVNAMLSTGGLRNISVTEQTTLQTSTDWKLNLTDGFTYSTKVADPDHPMQGEGNTLDFFQFFFFPSSGLNATGGDTFGMAEDINEFTNAKPGIDLTKKTKLVLRAGRLLMAGLGSPMQNAFKTAATEDDRLRFLSNVIAHEVGHALGLRHSFSVSTTGYTAAPATGGLMGNEASTPTITLAALGPVHEQVLKASFP